MDTTHIKSRMTKKWYRWVGIGRYIILTIVGFKNTPRKNKTQNLNTIKIKQNTVIGYANDIEMISNLEYIQEPNALKHEYRHSNTDTRWDTWHRPLYLVYRHAPTGRQNGIDSYRYKTIQKSSYLQDIWTNTALETRLNVSSQKETHRTL